MTEAFYTICTKSHLFQAHALVRSIRTVHPDARLFIGLVDRLTPDVDPAPLGDAELIEVEALSMPSLGEMSTRYRIPELCFACKPHFARHILRRHRDVSKLIYLDSDTFTFSRFDRVFRHLDHHCLVVTPHGSEPVRCGEDAIALERIILSAGILNAGFFAISRCEEAERFLDWFARILTTECHGWAGDQPWLALAPTYFEGVLIDRDPGLNMAAWNAGSRFLTQQDGQILVNGVPLVFYHYSGFDPASAASTSKIPAQSIRLASRPDLSLALSPIASAIREAAFAELRSSRSCFGKQGSALRSSAVLTRVAKRMLGLVGLQVSRAKSEC